MKYRKFVVLAVVLLLGAVFVGALGGSAPVNAQGGLTEGIPEPAAANFQAQNSIQEGGVHFFYTSSDSPGNVISNYQAALTNAGWTIESSGGDPFGMFGGGLTATNGDRYLKLNAGGPGGTTFINVCVWPSQPSDNNCGQNNNNNRNTSGAAALGSSAGLLDNVPEPAGATFQAENGIQEGGRHFFYTTSDSPGDAVSSYQSALEANGWNILSSGGGGDPFGLFGGGAGLTATDGTRYLKYNAGGPPGSTFINACIWPTQPSDDQCQNNNNNQSSGAAVLGSGGDLLAGVPELADAEFKAENAIQEGGRHFFFISSTAPGDLVGNYQAALEEAGWNIESSGGDPFGAFGAGLTATNGGRYLKLNAGGPPGGPTFINGCVWPSPPSNDNCGQNNNNQTTSGDASLGSGGDLLADVPEPAGASLQAQNAIQEGGRHAFYTSSDSPADVVSSYQSALEANGWTIESSGGGGDHFGLFGGGAGLTATNGDRYLKLNSGGPPGSTFINVCVWPSQPNNDNCGQNNNQTTSGDATLGSGGDLLAGVPEPANANFKAQDGIQEGGRHFFYTSTNPPADVVGNYESALTANGWNIESSGGGGDPFGLFGGGAGLTATNGDRYLKMNAGGPAGSTFVDVCVWPSQPSDNNCGQNNQQASAATAVMGSGGDLTAGIPEPANATFNNENSIQEGGRHFFYTSNDSPGNVVGNYQAALTAAGWNIESSGGDPFGAFGGGLTATNGARYLKLNAGGPPGGPTFINACVWPSQPSNDNCGQNNNNNNNNDDDDDDNN